MYSFPDFQPVFCSMSHFKCCFFSCIQVSPETGKVVYYFYLYASAVLRCFSCVQVFVTLWTVACQALLSMGFSRQEYWSVLSCPPPGDLPDPEIKPRSLMSPALAGRFFTISITQVPSVMHHNLLIFWSVFPQDPIVLDG